MNPFKGFIRKQKEKAMAQVIALIIRHALTASGVVGVLSDNDIVQLAGAAATVLGLALSWLEKRNKVAA